MRKRACVFFGSARAADTDVLSSALSLLEHIAFISHTTQKQTRIIENENVESGVYPGREIRFEPPQHRPSDILSNARQCLN